MSKPRPTVDLRLLADLGADRRAGLAAGEKALDEAVKELLRAKAAGADVNVEQAARLLTVAKTTLYRRLERKENPR